MHHSLSDASQYPDFPHLFFNKKSEFSCAAFHALVKWWTLVKPRRGPWSGGTYTVSICSKQCPESQLALIPIHILHNVKGLLKQTRRPRAQLSALPPHIIPASASADFHGSRRVSRTAQLSSVQNRSANGASQRKQPSVVSLSHDSPVIDTKSKDTEK